MSRIANTDPENWNGFRPDDPMSFDHDTPEFDPVEHARDLDEMRGAYDSDENQTAPVVELFDGLTPYQRGVADVVGDYADEVMGGRGK